MVGVTRAADDSLRLKSRPRLWKTVILSACALCFVLFGLWTITLSKEASTCAECRRLKWEYRWNNTPVWKSESDSSCSRWLHGHEAKTHSHAWIRGENVWFVGLLGDRRGVASRDYQSYIWRISPKEQLAAYQKANDKHSLQDARLLFRKFADYQRGAAEEHELIYAAKDLIGSSD